MLSVPLHRHDTNKRTIFNTINYKGMRYETIGGKEKDTEDCFTTLRFLRIGDRFKSKSGTGIWEVRDEKCNWNGQAGSPTRKCKNLETGAIEHKLCRVKVFKLN